MDRLIRSVGAYALLGLVIEGGALFLEWVFEPPKKTCEMCGFNGEHSLEVCIARRADARHDGNAGHG